MEDLNEAGGVYAVMKELADIGLLHTDCMTVTGETIGENIKDAANKNTDVIRTVENPYSKTGGLAVLKGNLAPDGSVVKRFTRSRPVCLNVRKTPLTPSRAEKLWQGTWW